MGKTKSGIGYKFQVGGALVNLIKKNSIEPINILGVDGAAQSARKSEHIKAKVVESSKKLTAQYGNKLTSFKKPKAHRVMTFGGKAKESGVKSSKLMPEIGMGDDIKGDYLQIKPEAEIISDKIEKFLTGIAMSSSANEIEIASKSSFTQVAGREVIRTFGLDVNKDSSQILKGLIKVFKRKKKSEFGCGSITVKNDRIILYVNRDKMAKPITWKEIVQQATKWQHAPELIKEKD